MRKKIFFALCTAIIIIGIIARFFRLDQYPPILNRDEAGLALNAAYIKQAGTDEWGAHFPLQFKSLGDYKLPGYIYTLSLFLWLGMNDVIVRLPSALAGVVIIIAFLFWFNVFQAKVSRATQILLLLFITFSPFALFYSRMAWEANLALASMLVALVCLFQKPFSYKKDVISVILFLISSITYNAPLLLLPFVTVILPFIRGMKNKKSWLPVCMGLSVVFIVVMTLFSQNNAQKSSILFFTDGNINAQYPEYRQNLPFFLRPVLGSRLGFYGTVALSHYINTFSPNFLVLKGGQHPWHSILGQGHVFWSVYVLFLFGLIARFKAVTQIFITKKQFSAYKTIPLYFLLVSPLPAVFTTDAPHATRSLFTFIMILFFAGVGVEKVLSLLKKQTLLRTVCIVLVISIVSLESSFHVYKYFIVWPTDFSRDFQIPLKSAVERAVTQHPEGNIGIMDPGLYLYVIVGWYQKVPVETALATIERTGPDQVGLFRVNRIGRFYFLYHKDDVFPQRAAVVEQGEQYGDWEFK